MPQPKTLTAIYSLGRPSPAQIDRVKIASDFGPFADWQLTKVVSAKRTIEPRLVAGLFLEGRFPPSAPATGGKPAEEISTGHWKLDDFAPRFATGSINMRRPFDPDAQPTDVIIVDRSTLQKLLDACCVDDPHYAEEDRRRLLIAPPDVFDGTATAGLGRKSVTSPAAATTGIFAYAR